MKSQIEKEWIALFLKNFLNQPNIDDALKDIAKSANKEELKSLILHVTPEIINQYKNRFFNDDNKKFTVLVNYEKWCTASHPMLDDELIISSEVVEVSKLTDLNDMFENIKDIKIL